MLFTLSTALCAVSLLGPASSEGFVSWRGRSVASGAGQAQPFRFRQLVLIKHLQRCRESGLGILVHLLLSVL